MVPSPSDPLVLSPSSLDCYQGCPKKYEFRYVKRTPPPDTREPSEFVLGRAVHKALHYLYAVRSESNPGSESELLEAFGITWQTCKADCEVEYTDSLDEASTVDLGKTMLRNFWAKVASTDTSETVGLECRVEFWIDADKTIKLRGFVDRLSLLPDGFFEVQDYKSGARLPTSEKIEMDRQLALYHLAVLETFPQTVGKQMRLVWYYLRHGARIEATRTAAQLDALKFRTLALARSIRAATVYPARPNHGCRFCAYRSLCSEYQAMRGRMEGRSVAF